MADMELDLVERKATLAGDAPNSVRQAICAFANDLPGHRRAGVVFVGVDDDGTPVDMEVNDALLLKLAHCKTDGNIVPPPTMTVAKRELRGHDVAVVTVSPSDSPPVRYRGRIWTRVGPRRALATAQDERILNEKRRHGDPRSMPSQSGRPSWMTLILAGSSICTSRRQSILTRLRATIARLRSGWLPPR